MEDDSGVFFTLFVFVFFLNVGETAFSGSAPDGSVGHHTLMADDNVCAGASRAHRAALPHLPPRYISTITFFSLPEI